MEIEATKEEYEKNIHVLAALEIIRVNQFEPFNLHIRKSSGSDTTSQYLYTKQFEVGYVYVITSICGMNNTDGAHQVKLGIKDGATHFVYNSATIANAGDSVEYVGQLMCKETDKIFVEFRDIGAADEIHLFINGYKIRR
ncbi:MAG: hypothetical protein QQN41_10075 [Nitrosopumilus sp.]